MGRLEWKVAVVTGAGRGIRRSRAVRFAREGEAAVVVVNDDTTELGAARALVARTVERFGTLGILVDNAGTTRDRTFHNLDDELWGLVLDTNVRTAFDATLAAVGHTRESAKRETAERGTPGHHRGLSPGELGRFHISVNALALGFIETRLTAPKGRARCSGWRRRPVRWR